MTLVVARKTEKHISIVGDTKLTPKDYEDIRLAQDPQKGIIKTIILNSAQAVSFAGNEYYAECALKEIRNGGDVENVAKSLYKFHLEANKETEFIFSYVALSPVILAIKNGTVEDVQSAWIGDQEAFDCFQRYFFKDIEQYKQDATSNKIAGEEIKNGNNFFSNVRISVTSKVPDDCFVQMSRAMDDLLYNRPVKTIGGFKVQVVYDEKFHFLRYTGASREHLEVQKGSVYLFGNGLAEDGCYSVNFSESSPCNRFAALHVFQANVGILFQRTGFGLMRPRLFKMDDVDFADFVAMFGVSILVSPPKRAAKYVSCAENQFSKGNFINARAWLEKALKFSERKQLAFIYYALALTFHNLGRLLSSELCFEEAMMLDPRYVEIVAKLRSKHA